MARIRFFWGTTKMDKVRVREYIDLDAQDSAPDAHTGRMYLNTDGDLMLCADGTNYSVVGSQS